MGGLIGVGLGYVQYVFLPQRQAEERLKYAYAKEFSEFASIVGWGEPGEAWITELHVPKKGRQYNALFRSNGKVMIALLHKVANGRVLLATLAKGGSLLAIKPKEPETLGRDIYRYQFGIELGTKIKVDRYKSHEAGLFKMQIYDETYHGVRILVDSNGRFQKLEVPVGGFPRKD